MVGIYKFDKFLGDTLESPRVLIGEHALYRAGLTTHASSILQCSTLFTGITGIFNPIVMWYFNPYASRYEHTRPSPKHPNILEPTKERALIEYIIFKDYFDEGDLIEGLQSYGDLHDWDYSALIEEAKYWKCKVDLVEYWIKEALDYYDVD